MVDSYGVTDNCVIGVDLGGTNVRAAAVGLNGMVLGEMAECPSHAREGAGAVIQSCITVIREAMEGRRASAIGMAVPGHIDVSGGIVRWAPNFGETVDGVFRHFADVSLAAPISDAVGLPVKMGNDANLAALGEYKFGVGENRAIGLVMFTMGTGIGGGVVLHPGQLGGGLGTPTLLVGANGGAAELGHTVVMADGPLCGCGAYGCLEALINAKAISDRGRAKLEHHPDGKLAELSGGDPSLVNPKLMEDAAMAGDQSAREAWEEIGHYLGIGIANAIDTFVPETVTIGGQISKAGALLLDPAIRSAKDHAIPTLFSATKIVQAKHVELAGVLGGAALAAGN